jgi:C1A family cysteine protease
VRKGYGWKPQQDDVRDLDYDKSYLARKLGPPRLLPPSVDLRPFEPPVFDQGQLGSCTANATCAAAEFLGFRVKKAIPLSRLFLYYATRAAEGTITEDAGAELRDVIKVGHQRGICAETVWPYDENRFADAPPPAAYAEAMTRLFTAYYSIDDNTRAKGVKTALADGLPVIFGFSVYDAFESDAVAVTGKVPIPLPSDRPVGGHAVLAVGYDDGTNDVIVRNSWGPNWGDKGYFRMPYDYIFDPTQANDFWVLTHEMGL